MSSTSICFRMRECPPTFAAVAARHQPQLTIAVTRPSQSQQQQQPQLSRRASSTTAATTTATTTYNNAAPMSAREQQKQRFQDVQEHSVFLPFLLAGEDAVTTSAGQAAAQQQQQQQRYHPFATSTVTHSNVFQHMMMAGGGGGDAGGGSAASATATPSCSTLASAQIAPFSRTAAYCAGSAAAATTTVPAAGAISARTSANYVASPRRGVASARGRWMHESHIRIAGPETSEPLAFNPVPGVPRMGGAHHRAGGGGGGGVDADAYMAAPPAPTQRSASVGAVTAGAHDEHNNKSRNTSHQHGSDAAAATPGKMAMAVRRANSELPAARPGPSAGPAVSSKDALRDLLSKETFALRHSQRFAATPRAVPGDHLAGSGAGLLVGRTPAGDVFSRSDSSTLQTLAADGTSEAASACAGAGHPMHVHHSSFTNSFTSSAAAAAAAPPVASAATMMHRFRPSSARLATEQSRMPTLDEEFAAHSKVKHIQGGHVDAHSNTLNILQPWAASATATTTATTGSHNYQQLSPHPVGTSRQTAAAGKARRPLSAQTNAVRSVAQTIYDKSSEMRGAMRAADLVTFGDGQSREAMKTRMLRGTTALW